MGGPCLYQDFCLFHTVHTHFAFCDGNPPGMAYLCQTYILGSLMLQSRSIYYASRGQIGLLSKGQVDFVTYFQLGVQIYTWINTSGAQEEYSEITRSTLWLLMPWLLALPGHQQSQYCLCRMHRFLASMREVLNNPYHFNVDKWQNPSWNVGWNYLSIPKLQLLHYWSLGMD